MKFPIFFVGLVLISGAAALRCERIRDDGKMPTHVECPDEKTNDKFSACMAVWTNNTENGTTIRYKDCWTHDNFQMCPKDGKCTAEKRDYREGVDSPFFCCCTADLCNQNLVADESLFEVAADSDSGRLNGTSALASRSNIGLTLLFPIVLTCCSVVLIGTIVFAGFRAYVRFGHVPKAAAETDTMLPVVKNNHAPIDIETIGLTTAGSSKVLLLETLAHGRFSKVVRGKLKETNEIVAVKIFAQSDIHAWTAEQEIYALQNLSDQANIVRYMGSEICNADGMLEYWLMTEYQANGSLCSYLKTHIVRRRVGAHMCCDILRGLAFLHSELVGADATLNKPSIVHRDLKSTNVLLAADLTAKVADFGLAVKCEKEWVSLEGPSQAGTRRYMAPEVLECYTEFSAFAFRQIDVYACALVLWEVLSRLLCGGHRPGEYMLPFQEEVGAQPTLADMKKFVCDQKRRPGVQEHWLVDSDTALIVHTMEEMWDREPEARLTAGCALERLSTLLHTHAPHSQHLHEGV